MSFWKRFFSSSNDEAVKEIVNLSIQPSQAQIEQENIAYENMLSIAKENIVRSKLIKVEKIDAVMQLIRKSTGPFQRLCSSKALDGGEVLSVNEKKLNGLNTRMKYTANFVDCLAIDRDAANEPKAIFDTLLLDAYHKSNRAKTLQELHGKDFVSGVKIVSLGCKEALKCEKTYKLDQVPNLPLVGCTENCCMCYYQPVLNI